MFSDKEANINQKFIIKSKSDFENIFRTYFAELTVFAFRYTQSQETAEEIVQDIFFNLWNNLNKTVINISVKSYLYQTVKNTCLNYIKHLKVEEKYKNYAINQIQNTYFEEENTNDNSDIFDKINAAIEKMPRVRKQVFILSKKENLKYKEIAEKLQISVKTVENHMGRALKFLREELSDLFPFLIFLFFK